MSQQIQSLITEAESSLLHTYNRYQIVIDRGEGTYIYDTEGKKYLDFVSGIAVFALGYHFKDYDDALKTQIDKIIHTSNYYYNIPTTEAAKKLLSFAQMDRVFFTNSGSEAVEGALKAARKYAFQKDGRTDHEFIAMNHSFHGRTFGALSVTGNAHYREPFEPLIGPVHFGELNKIDTIMPLINDKTCAIILETVQGEGGIHPVQPQFLQKIHEICQEKDILLILDEIQCGMGRCGYPFAWQKYGIRPDIMTCAKALGCGVPVGAFLMTERVAASSLVAGDHGTTYGGNPLAGAAVEKVLDLFASNHIIEHVQEITPYLEQQLDRLCTDYPFITERRGAGLMQGLQFNRSVAPVINLAMQKGLLLINAGADVLRLMPSLIIEKQHIDEMILILRECLDQQSD
jgi:acetylornithine/N-succinyldiaminopimelate aminotransferase